MELIDVHAHLFDANMPVSPAEAVAAGQAAGVVQMVVPGLDVATSREAIEIADQFPGVCFATVGVHPSEVLIEGFDLETTIAELKNLVGQPDSSTPGTSDDASGAQNDMRKRVVGIGEIGIDYYHYDRAETGKTQREAFAAQLSLAVEHDLPVIIHGRNAYDDVLDVIRAHPGSRGLLHSFEASYEVAKQALDLGWIISFTALVTYPGNEYLLDVVRKLPIDRISVETDAPYLPPQSVRERSHQSPVTSSQVVDSRFTIHDSPVIGKRGRNNQPAYMVETAQTLADARGISLEELATATTATARTLFGLPSGSTH